jgi:hypothetical protein
MMMTKAAKADFAKTNDGLVVRIIRLGTVPNMNKLGTQLTTYEYMYTWRYYGGRKTESQVPPC